MEVSKPERNVVGENWVLCAGVFFLVVGAFNVIYGIAGLVEHENLAEEGLFFWSLEAWGWILLVLGAVQLVASALIFARRVAGQFLGIFLALLSVFAHLLTIAAFPLWSAIAIAVAGIVIYALTVYGDEFV